MKKLNCMSVPRAIRELDKSEEAYQPDGEYRLDRAVTATLKAILKAFGLNEDYVNNKERERFDAVDGELRRGMQWGG